MILTRLVLLTALTAVVSASPGDDLEAFETCVEDCKVLICWNIAADHNITAATYPQLADFSTLPLPRYLTWLHWNCEQNCDYECQRIVTRDRRAAGEEVLQFHGKWPFRRVAGIQEVFSMLFSVGNFLPHYWGIKRLYRQYALKGPNRHQARRVYRQIMFSVAVTMGAWTCSTIYHIRDVLFTERADYYMAGATVLAGFYTITTCHFRLYAPEYRWRFFAFTLFCVVLYVAHLARLMIDWSYTYNMQVNVIFGALQNAVWVRHSYALFRQYDYLEELASLDAEAKAAAQHTKDHSADDKSDTPRALSPQGPRHSSPERLTQRASKRIDLLATPPATAEAENLNTDLPAEYPSQSRLVPLWEKTKPFQPPRFHGLVSSPKVYALLPILLNCMFAFGMAFEIFDFPPFWDLVDAHALWHLATIYPSWRLYEWFIWDVETNVADVATANEPKDKQL